MIMKKSIGTRMFFSKFNKVLITFALCLTTISFLLHFYYYLTSATRLKNLVDEFSLVLAFLFLYVIVVKENPRVLKFLRSKVGILVSWCAIFIFTYYGLDYPSNVIIIALFLIFLILHYSIRYVGKKRHAG